MIPEAERLWRCKRCKKWSHAKKCPTHHERFLRYRKDIPYSSGEFNKGEFYRGQLVIREDEGWYSKEESNDGGIWVQCGPFEAWEAYPVRELIDPVCTMHGKKASEHVCLYCTLCFSDLKPEECVYLTDGSQTNVCLPCATRDAGLCADKGIEHDYQL